MAYIIMTFNKHDVLYTYIYLVPETRANHENKLFLHCENSRSRKRNKNILLTLLYHLTLTSDIHVQVFSTLIFTY